jgi:hypothetical protein
MRHKKCYDKRISIIHLKNNTMKKIALLAVVIILLSAPRLHEFLRETFVKD